MDKQDLRDVWQYVVLIAPAPIGALIGMRYAVDQSPKARAYTFLCSMGLGAVGGAFCGEYWQLGPAAVAVSTVVVASVGMELLAGVHTAARSFSVDPFGILTKVFSILRKGEP